MTRVVMLKRLGPSGGEPEISIRVRIGSKDLIKLRQKIGSAHASVQHMCRAIGPTED